MTEEVPQSLVDVIEKRKVTYRDQCKRKGQAVSEAELEAIEGRALREYADGLEFAGGIPEPERNLCRRFYEEYLSKQDPMLDRAETLGSLYVNARVVIVPCYLAYLSDLRQLQALLESN